MKILAFLMEKENSQSNFLKSKEYIKKKKILLEEILEWVS